MKCRAKMLNNRVLRILVTMDMSIVVSIPEMLLPEILQLFYCEKLKCSLVESADVTISIKDNLYVISTFYETIKCAADEYLFHLITVIENLAVSKFNNCVLHGSAISYGAGNAIAFVGKSGSGKTTIMRNITNKTNCNSIADDLLFLRGNNMLSTVLLPYKIKPADWNNNLGDLCKINLKRADYNNIRRMFPIVSIVSVDYDMANCDTFCKQDFICGFSLLVRNSRKSVNTKNLAQAIASLLKVVSVYELHYSNTSFAMKSVSALISEL